MPLNIEINPKEAKVHNNYAILLAQHFKELKLAKMHFLTALEINPNDEEAKNNLKIINEIISKGNDKS